MGIERVSLPRLIGAEKEKRKREWRSLHYSLAVAGSLALCMAAGRPLHYFSPFIFLSASVWLRFFWRLYSTRFTWPLSTHSAGFGRLVFFVEFDSIRILKKTFFSVNMHMKCVPFRFGYTF